MNYEPMLSKKQKTQSLRNTAHEADTGSPQVQIALLTREVEGAHQALEGSPQGLQFPPWSY